MKKLDLSPLGVEALLRGRLCHMGDDRSEVAQPMHGLDVNVEVRCEGSHAAWKYAVRSPGANRCWLAGGRCSTQSGVGRGNSCRLIAA